MPRVSRNNSRTKFHHVIVQGVNKSFIFSQYKFIIKYKQIIVNKLKESNIIILAYCIMGNHAHFLVYSDKYEYISKFLQRVNTSYAKYYNKTNKHVGYVFNGRFYSQEIWGPKQLYICLKYIHNNPVKAGLCKSMEQYPFSSYNEFLKFGQIITENSIKLLFQNSKNYKQFFSLIHSHELLEDLTVIDIKNTEISDFLSKIEAKYNKDLNIIKRDKSILKEIVQGAMSETTVTIRELADLLGIPKSTIGNYCKK